MDGSVFSLRGRRKRQSRLPRILLPLLLILLLVSASGAVLHRQLCRAAGAAAETAMSDAVSESARRVIADGMGKYGDLIKIMRDQAGRITSIEAVPASVSALSAAFTAELISLLPAGCEVSFPIGNLSGSHLLNGKGGRIGFQMSLVGGIAVDIESEFTSAGINQTRHRILLRVRISSVVFLPGSDVGRYFESTYPIAETVIVGEVPGVYLNTGK